MVLGAGPVNVANALPTAPGQRQLEVMKTTACLLLGSALLSLPARHAHAQPDPAARCRALLASIGLVQDGPAEIEPLGPDGCRFTGVRFGFGTRFGYLVASLTEHGIPFGPLAIPDKPTEVAVEARGVTFSLHSGNPKVDWLNRAQQVPFDVVVRGRYDPAAHEVLLRELSLTGRTVGRTTLSADVVGVDPADLPGNPALRALTLHMDSRSFVVRFLLGVVVSMLPEQNPGAAFDAAKRQAVAAARAKLPQGGVAPASVDAIAAFINDLPRPQHVLDLTIATKAPISMEAASVAMADAAAAAALVNTMQITATYAGDPQ